MCGIVGYVGPAEAAPIVLDGLAQLEYRGYDSAGIAVLGADGDADRPARTSASSPTCAPVSTATPKAAGTGIGHTRWATHGRATQLNAHPHTDVQRRHRRHPQRHRRELPRAARRSCTPAATSSSPRPTPRSSPTSSPSRRQAGLDLEAATAASHAPHRRRRRRAGDAPAGAGRHHRRPHRQRRRRRHRLRRRRDVRCQRPPGHRSATRHSVVFLEDGEMALRHRARARPTPHSHGEVHRQTAADAAVRLLRRGQGRSTTTTWPRRSPSSPRQSSTPCAARVEFDPPAVELPDLHLSDAEIAGFNRVVLIGMGTSFHTAQIGRTYIEQLAGLPAEVDNASEYRYRAPDPRRAHAGRRRGAVGRDRRHPRGHARGAAARRQGRRRMQHARLAGHARRRRHRLHALRPGDRRCLDQDLPRLADCALFARLPPRPEARLPQTRSACWRALSDLARMPQLVGEALKTEDRCSAGRRGASRDHEHFLFLGRGLRVHRRHGRRPQAQGGQLHPRRRLRRRRDEARPDCPDRSNMPVVAIAVRGRSTTPRCSATSKRCAPAKASSSPSPPRATTAIGGEGARRHLRPGAPRAAAAAAHGDAAAVPRLPHRPLCAAATSTSPATSRRS